MNNAYNLGLITCDKENDALNEQEVYFTRKEYDLLLYIIYNKGKAISKSDAADRSANTGASISRKVLKRASFRSVGDQRYLQNAAQLYQRQFRQPGLRR